MRSRYSVQDAYVVEELRRDYEAAEPGSRIRIIKRLQKLSELPLAIAWLAAKDSSTEVRCWFARHGDLSSFDSYGMTGDELKETDWQKELVGTLLNEPDPFVHACLHENPSALGALCPDGNWIRYFKGIKHIERLALVRNPIVDTKLIERIFDFNDEALRELDIDEDARKELALGFGAAERKELALAFLDNEKRLHRLAHEAWVCPQHDPKDYDYADLYFESPYASREADRFLSAVWELASKWPADLESGERSEVAAIVFRTVPVSAKTRQRIYSACADRDLRLNILDGCRNQRPDEATIRLGLQDTDDACREHAYSVLGCVPVSQVEELLQRGDKLALRGLARNRSVPKAALKKIGEWFEKHFPHDDLISPMIHYNLADRQHEKSEEESLPLTELEIMMRRSKRLDWLASKLDIPGSWRAWFLLVAALSIFHVPELAAILLFFGYWGFAALDRWLVEKAKSRAINDELWNWETDEDDPTHENRGNLTRVRLIGQNQIVVARIADVLKRMP